MLITKYRNLLKSQARLDQAIMGTALEISRSPEVTTVVVPLSR